MLDGDPPPHPVIAPRPRTTRNSGSRSLACRLTRANEKRQAKSPDRASVNGAADEFMAVVVAVVLMDSAVVTALPLGVTVLGEKPQAASDGNPVHAKLTD